MAVTICLVLALSWITGLCSSSQAEEQSLPLLLETANRDCRNWLFTCKLDKCTISIYRCDRRADCEYRIEEVGCSLDEEIADKCATKGRFFCLGSKKCRSIIRLCDGAKDCVDDGWDEHYCPSKATTTPKAWLPACGITSVNRIFGGSEAKQANFPWVVSIAAKFKKVRKSKSCGAALISDQWLLTAAHCVIYRNHKVDHVVAQLGRFDLLDPKEQGFKVKSSAVYIHPDYDHERNLNNDFALVKLSKKVPFSSRIAPVCLPEHLCDNSDSDFDSKIDGCQQVMVAGWGTTEHGKRSSKMLSAKMYISPRTSCNRAYTGTFTSNHICVGDGSQSICSGDSGGPLLCKSSGRMFVIGVVSGGPDKCGDRHPAIFARVCSQREWIEKIMQQGEEQ